MATPLSKAPCGAAALLALVVASMAVPACKPTSTPEEPEPTAKPTYPSYVPPTIQAQSFVQITPTVKPPCDSTLYECNPDAKVVDLCKQQQQDQTKCDPYIEKTLYEQIKAKVAEGNSECKSTSYVKTQEGGTVRVRSSMDTSNSGNILGQVGHGSSLCVLGTEGSWYKIKFASGTGYISGTYVSASQPGPVVPKPSTPPSSGTGTSNNSPGPAAPSGCAFSCPSGYFCTPTEKWLNVNNPSYHSADSNGNVSEKNPPNQRIPAPAAVCASGTRKHVSEGWNQYTMVKIRLSPQEKSDYWMNCKYLADQAQQKIGCQ